MLWLETVGRSTAIAQLGDGRYLRTNDAGRHWLRYRLRYKTSFATPKIGLAFRIHVRRGEEFQRIHLLATRNGGRTWTRRKSPCHPGVASALVDLVTPRLGWVMCLGSAGAGAQAKLLFRTTNGGRSWKALAGVSPFPSSRSRGGISPAGYPEGISFAPNGFGLLWEERGTLYVTRDGGSHWTGERKLARPEIDFGRGGAAFSDGTGFVLLGRGGGPQTRLLETRDYGRSWRERVGWDIGEPVGGTD